MKKIISFFFLFLNILVFAQKEDLVYSPINNTSLEQSFPNVFDLLKNVFKIDIIDFNYDKKELLSNWYEFTETGIKYRCKFVFKINNKKSLDIQIVNTQKWTNDWVNSDSKNINEVENKLKAAIAYGIRGLNSNKEKSKKNYDLFFKDLVIFSFVFNNSTELASVNYFNTYLKNKNVNWEVFFNDIYIVKNKEFKYNEKFYYLNLYLLDKKGGTIVINKLTNNSDNQYLPKDTLVVVSGFCREFKYDYLTKTLYFLLNDTSTSYEDKLKNNTQQKDYIKELRDLKSLLDEGIITEEEFKKEKEKILNNHK